MSDFRARFKSLRFRPQPILKKENTEQSINKHKRMTLSTKDPIKFFEQVEGKLNHLLFKRRTEMMIRNGKKHHFQHGDGSPAKEIQRPSSIEPIGNFSDDIEGSPQKSAVDKFLSALNPNANLRKAQHVRRKSCYCSECGGMSNLEYKTRDLNIPNKRTVLRENKSITKMLRRKSKLEDHRVRSMTVLNTSKKNTATMNSEMVTPTKKTTPKNGSAIQSLAEALGNRDMIMKLLNNLKDSKRQIMSTTNIDTHVHEKDEFRTEESPSNDCTIFDDRSPSALAESSAKKIIKKIRPKLVENLKVGSMYGFKIQKLTKSITPLSQNLPGRKKINPELEKDFIENFSSTILSPKVGSPVVAGPLGFKFPMQPNANPEHGSDSSSQNPRQSEVPFDPKKKILNLKKLRLNKSKENIRNAYMSSPHTRVLDNSSCANSVASSASLYKPSLQARDSGPNSYDRQRIILSEKNNNALHELASMPKSAKHMGEKRKGMSIKQRPSEYYFSAGSRTAKNINSSSKMVVSSSVSNLEKTKLIGLVNLDNVVSPKSIGNTVKSPNFIIKKRQMTPLNRADGVQQQQSFLNKTSRVSRSQRNLQLL